jgi:hypothetical protein
VGAVVAVALYTIYNLMFILRLLDRPMLGRWVAALQFLAVLPLVFLLVIAPRLERPPLYIIQVSLMLVFLVIEMLLDYLLVVEFRQVSWAVISYVTFFFAATGGMLGVAAQSGRVWSIPAVILFLIMAVLAFIQRAVTGM